MFKCAMCGSTSEDGGTCCGDMREEMCEECSEAMSMCTCSKDEDEEEDEDGEDDADFS